MAYVHLDDTSDANSLMRNLTEKSPSGQPRVSTIRLQSC